MPNLGLDNLIHRIRDRFGHAFHATVTASVQATIGAVHGAHRLSTPSRCRIAGCNEPAIDSHVIPRSFLTANGSGGGLRTPVVIGGTAVEMRPMTGSSAPTFPGYCHDHDDRLFAWEKTGRFSGPDAPASQLMRVTDASIHEVGLRAAVLSTLGRELAPTATGLQHVSHLLGPADAAFLTTEAASLAQSATEAAPLLADLRRLRDALDRSRSASGPGAFIRSVHVPDVDWPQFADALRVPRRGDVDFRDPTPLAMCGLSDPAGFHLVLGALDEGKEAVLRLESELRAAPSKVLAFALHCLTWGTHYSFVSEALWSSLDRPTQADWEKRLSFIPHTRGAFSSDPVRIPFIRAGNGWL